MELCPWGGGKNTEVRLLAYGHTKKRRLAGAGCFPPSHPAAPLNNSSLTPASFQNQCSSFPDGSLALKHPFNKPLFCLRSKASSHLLSTY